ncbi:hypothetical protein VOLCADRAFT_101455 [Volvox carteri f. nagariensis]|uniref:Uncharacterized protein n=1 Tax=Volvox carteri f. nagariensis TaxID=3068 RepID=D8UMP9_VOLCA|nr:uncharacterized protein VOLCADRAFT_101455 [Volvox carteri f. nagariensis]EFJ39000.1 hypothetical protein VOLCADRAFT_101455 [Volvox carteri f. nagariensis]|eukprot:XP_002959934.1 hypothetical protein VOLCADRAFT_101455 [Volvox carteri f. nagariensis]
MSPSWVPSPHSHSHSQAEGLSATNQYPPAGSPSWAYDMGVAQSSSNGVVTTTICFSRRLSDSRPRVSQNITTDGSKNTTFIWAISTVDGFKEHSSVNRGGFYLDLGLAGRWAGREPLATAS